jgi:hypothetical protein
MINPNENNFTEQDPSTLPPRSEPEFSEEAGDLGGAPTFPSSSADTWAQRRERLSHARKRTQLFLRDNPIPSLLGALGLGVALGWALRHGTIGEEKEREDKTPLANLNWSFLSLPFLWPFFRSVKERYEDSAESLKDGVDRLKKIDLGDYAKPIRKRWKAWKH